MVETGFSINNFNLVGGFTPSEGYEFVNGKDDIPYMKWKIKAMLHVPNHQAVINDYQCLNHNFQWENHHFHPFSIVI